jgi:hypothetical protein
MMDARRYRHLIRLLGFLVLGAFLLGTAPCVLAHAGDHEDAGSTCVCICCGEPLSMGEPAATRMAIHPPTSRAMLPGADEHTPRDIFDAIFQPPKA